MLLWKQYITVLPIRYKTIKYEDIIDNIETSIKPLINFIDLIQKTLNMDFLSEVLFKKFKKE